MFGYQGTPELRLNPAQHTAMINRMDMDRERRWLVTASDDKSARLWRLSEGALHRVFRPYSGAGNEGKLFAVAISPDASLVAAGGWTKGEYRGFGNHKVYLFDGFSGELATRFAGLDNTILHLDFSPLASKGGEGLTGFLVCSLAGKNGIRVWDLKNQTEALRDMTYAGDSYWAEFSADGEWLVSTSQDGYVRLYGWRQKGHHMERRAQVKLDTPGAPMAARFSPDGQRIAVGYVDEGAVAVLSAHDLSLEYWTEKATGGSGDLFATAWSESGEQLYGGGGFHVDSRFAAVQWREGRQVAAWPLADDTLMQLDAQGDQGMVYVASTPSWGIFGEQGESVFKASRPTLAFHRIFPDEFQLSADAKIVEFGYSDGEQQGRLRFSVADRLLAPPPRVDEASPETSPTQGVSPQSAPQQRDEATPLEPATATATQAPSKTPGETPSPAPEMTVEQAQRILTELGYAPGPLDNVLGSETREAVTVFQRKRGLAESGELTPETVAALRAAVETESEEEAPAAPPVTLHGPKTTSETLQLSSWRNSAEPRLNDQPLSLTKNDTAMSYAFAHQADGVLLGTRFRLHYFDGKGEERWQKRTPGVAWAVNIAANDKVLAAAFSDGTLRWYALADGRELFALYPHADRERWIGWTPNGLYAASVDGDELAGWVLNNRETEAADFIPLANLHQSAYRPTRFAEILAAADKAEESITLASAADAAAAPESEQAKVSSVFPPRLLIDQPRDGDDFSTPEIEVTYALREHGGEPPERLHPERLHVLVDGRPWSETEFEPDENGGAGRISVTLPPRDLLLTLIADSVAGFSPAESIRLNWRGEASPQPQSTLYLLVIGVGDYSAHEALPDVPQCEASALALAEKLPSHTLAAKVETKLLINPSSEEAIAGLNWLNQAEQTDLALAYLCGHTARLAGPAIDAFQFFPIDAQGLGIEVFRETLTKPRGQVVVMLDTSHLPRDASEGADPRVADVEGFANVLSQPLNGISVLVSAVAGQPAEVAQESK